MALKTSRTTTRKVAAKKGRRKRSPTVHLGAATIEIKSSMSAHTRAHQPLPDYHPFNAVIGHVVLEFARFEHILDMMIWHLSGISGSVLI